MSFIHWDIFLILRANRGNTLCNLSLGGAGFFASLHMKAPLSSFVLPLFKIVVSALPKVHLQAISRQSQHSAYASLSLAPLLKKYFLHNPQVFTSGPAFTVCILTFNHLISHRRTRWRNVSGLSAGSLSTCSAERPSPATSPSTSTLGSTAGTRWSLTPVRMDPGSRRRRFAACRSAKARPSRWSSWSRHRATRSGQPQVHKYLPTHKHF